MEWILFVTVHHWAHHLSLFCQCSDFVALSFLKIAYYLPFLWCCTVSWPGGQKSSRVCLWSGTGTAVCQWTHSSAWWRCCAEGGGCCPVRTAVCPGSFSQPALITSLPSQAIKLSSFFFSSLSSYRIFLFFTSASLSSSFPPALFSLFSSQFHFSLPVLLSLPFLWFSFFSIFL